MDAWPAFWEHNKPLHEQMIARGYRFKRNKKTAHFVEGDDRYVCFPRGYITGVGYHDNGNPRPYYASVYDGEAWRQQSFPTRQEAIDWALEQATALLADSSV